MQRGCPGVVPTLRHIIIDVNFVFQLAKYNGQLVCWFVQKSVDGLVLVCLADRGSWFDGGSWLFECAS